MARDWRKVALAVLAAAALASVCVLGSRVEAQQAAKTAKAPANRPHPKQRKTMTRRSQAKAPAKKKRQDPVEAQRAIDAADKLLQGGKAEQAAQALTATLAGGNLPPAIMARALYMRGIGLPPAEQAGAGDFRSHERALAQGRAHGGRSRRMR